MPHLAAVNLHDRCPSSISTSKISHVTENRNWFWFNLEGNQLTHPRPVKYKNVLNQFPFNSTTFSDWVCNFCFHMWISLGLLRKCRKMHFTSNIINYVVYLLDFHVLLPMFFFFGFLSGVDSISMRFRSLAVSLLPWCGCVFEHFSWCV